MGEPRFEQPKRYTLPEGNIISLDEKSEIFQRGWLKDLREKEGIEWPIEFQGSAHTYPDAKEFKIWYPNGDIFLSASVVIHELGHWRQAEIDEKFDQVYIGPDMKCELKYPENHQAMEDDAWQRGRQRVSKYAQEFLDYLDERFKQLKQAGKLIKFNSFEEFFGYAGEIGDKISRLHDGIADEVDDSGQARLLAEKIREDEQLKEFFADQQIWRAGEKIDKNQIEEAIKKVANGVAEERY